MKSKIDFERICNEIYLRHTSYFDASNTKVKNYVYIDNGEIKLYPGMIPDIKVYEDIKSSLGIKDSSCEGTYI